MNRSTPGTINFSIVLFLISLPLVGMDVFNPTLNQNAPLFPENHIGLDHFNTEFINIMINPEEDQTTKLVTLWHYAEKENIFSFIEPTRLQTISSLICKNLHDQGKFIDALPFAADDTERGIICRHMAEKARLDGNFDLEKESYTLALNFFKRSQYRDKKAELHCENALWNSLGCTYNATDIRNHYISHLKANISKPGYLDTYAYNISQKKHTAALQKLLKLANDDAGTQCVLARMYYRGEFGLPTSYETSLKFCQKAIYSLAVLPIGEESAHEYISLPVTLNRLCNDHTFPNFQKKAFTLQKYFDVISAIKSKDESQLQKLRSLYQNATDLSSVVMQLLCSCINESAVKTVQDLTFNDAQFIQFCLSEGKLAAHALEWILLDVSLSQKEKDIYHMLLGGYEYHKKNFDRAISHLKQCSYFKKDIYLQSLELEHATSETNSEKMALLLPLLQKSLNRSEKNARIKRAHKIIATACEYDPSSLIQEIMATCEKITLRTLSSHEEDPFEQGYVLFADADAHKEHQLCSAEQGKIKTLTSYCMFFDALNSKNQKRIDQFFSTQDDTLNTIRFIILRSIRSKNKNGILSIICEDKSFQDFCVSDGFIIKQILEKILEYPDASYNIKHEDCHYILGGIASVENNYEAALKHFSYCDISNDYVLAKIIEATNIKDVLTPLKKYISLSKTKTGTNSNNPNQRNSAADQLMKKILNSTLIAIYMDGALKEYNYEKAYDFIDCLMQLNIPETYSSLCNWFIALEKNIVQLPEGEYQALLDKPYRTNVYNAVQKNAHKKCHDGCFCNCLAYILLEHNEHKPHTKKINLDRKKQCLNYLLCSLKHEVLTTDTSRQNKLDTCGHLAHFFGVMENSSDLIDLAIKCGNSSALRTKARFLARENNKNNSHEIIKLLEQHAKSNDDPAERALSYNDLGNRLYQDKKKQDLKSKKMTFDYFKAAADLGNYEKGHFLAGFYIDGIKNYQAVDREKALLCLEKTMALDQRDSYGEALFLHASVCYGDQQYKRAESDLKTLIARTDYSDIEKLLPYWLMGLTQLNLLDGQTNLSPEAVSNLKKAYIIASNEYLLDQSTPLIQNLALCNHPQTMRIIESKINHIFEYKKDDALSLEFCSIIGCVLFQQCQNKPITDIYRKFALSILIYAAQNKSADAAMWLINVTNDEVSLWDKIYYIEMLSADSFIAEIVHTTLQELYPENVLGQAQLVDSFAEKNNDLLLKKYLTQLYENHMPLVINPLKNNAKNIIEKCLRIPVLIEAAAGFLENPIESDPMQHYSAIFLGSLLSYSSDSKELLRGARYLEASRTNFPTKQIQQIEINLEFIYHKLGCLAQKDGNQILTKAYFNKSNQLNKLIAHRSRSSRR